MLFAAPPPGEQHSQACRTRTQAPCPDTSRRDTARVGSEAMSQGWEWGQKGGRAGWAGGSSHLIGLETMAGWKQGRGGFPGTRDSSTGAVRRWPQTPPPRGAGLGRSQRFGADAGRWEAGLASVSLGVWEGLRGPDTRR